MPKSAKHKRKAIPRFDPRINIMCPMYNADDTRNTHNTNQEIVDLSLLP